MSSNIHIIAVPPLSDGDPTHRPEGPQYRLVRPCNLYLEKLGTAYATHTGKARPGTRYILNALPAGYDVFEKTRANGAQTDRWLFGNSNHKWFDSPNRFVPHFLHFVDNQGSNVGCPCTVCAGTAGRGPSMPGKTAVKRPAGRSRLNGTGSASKPMTLGQLDEEGNPDVYRNLIDRLKRANVLDVPITEPMSMDWRVERERLRKQLDGLRAKPAWLPRVGEVVLFVRDTQIKYMTQSKKYLALDTATGAWSATPHWEAGVVTQVSEIDLTVDDLVTERVSDYQLNYSGFRVEPLPDPNSKDKALSRQYKYVPLSCMRPFSLWRHLIDEAEYSNNLYLKPQSPTLRNARKAMRTLSLVDKFNFSGTWPDAAISCRAMYIGSELLVVGDVVALFPLEGGGKATDILQISSIKMKLRRLDEASGDDKDGGHPYNTTVHVTGTSYTTDQAKGVGPVQLDHVGLGAFKGYGEGRWFRRHAAGKKLQVPFSRIMCRLHEFAAMEAWFAGGTATPGFDFYSDSVRAGRADAERHDRRIMPGKQWFWGDSRADSLDLHTINGQEVARYDGERDAAGLRKEAKYLEGVRDEQDRRAVRDEAGRRRPLRDYAQRSNLGMVAAAMHMGGGNLSTGDDDDDVDDVDDGADDVEEGRARKRSRSVAQGSSSQYNNNGNNMGALAQRSRTIPAVDGAADGGESGRESDEDVHDLGDDDGDGDGDGDDANDANEEMNDVVDGLIRELAADAALPMDDEMVEDEGASEDEQQPAKVARRA